MSLISLDNVKTWFAAVKLNRVIASLIYYEHIALWTLQLTIYQNYKIPTIFTICLVVFFLITSTGYSKK